VVLGKTIIATKGTVIDKELIKVLAASEIESICVHSILTCETEEGVCQKCYGLDLAHNTIAAFGTPIGIIAAQSIGEPGTQLTMRTFHSGGVATAGGDITTGLTRVEELFEARNPKYESAISELDGEVALIQHEGKNVVVTIQAHELQSKDYYLPDDSFVPQVKKGDKVTEKQILAKSKESKIKLNAEQEGVVTKIENGVITIRDEEPQTREYTVESGRNLLVQEGNIVQIGDKLTEGHINIHHLMEIAGVLKTQLYIVGEIKGIYSSQGQTVNSKHIELIIRQMFSKVKITNAGDSSFFPGDIVDIIKFKKENDLMSETSQKQAIGTRLLLGLTKISLFTDSWLSAASFQETVRVLVDASTARKIDKLEGLKENVIIGRLIPTLAYFENNRDVGEYFGSESEDEYSHRKGYEREIPEEYVNMA
jgi:DNA-directed RNA polymerase subunit beta'